MPMKRRIDKSRDTPRVTVTALDLFERIMRLRHQRDWLHETRDLRCALNVELDMKPFNPDIILHCDGERPPDRDWPRGVQDWWHSRRIRLELEVALRERQAARRAKAAPTPAAPPNQPPLP
jgi:hypothetical protein